MKKRVALLLAAALVFSSVNADCLVTTRAVNVQNDGKVSVENVSDEINDSAEELTSDESVTTASQDDVEYDGKDVYDRSTDTTEDINIGYPQMDTPVTKQNLDLSDIELPGTDIGQKQGEETGVISGPEEPEEDNNGEVTSDSSLAADMEETAEINCDYDEISGTLTISGNGVMQGYENVTDTPWATNLQDIKNIVIEDGITEICAGAFSGANNLISVSLPDTLQKIDTNAFSDCISLQSIDLPDSVYSIGFKAFAGCTELTSVDLPVNWTENPSCNDTVNADNCGHIFEGCSKLTAITIPEDMTILPSYAFAGCADLIDITFPQTLTEVKNHAFYNCSGIAEVTLPEGVTSIGKSAFCYCSHLKNVNLSDQLVNLGTYAFYSCTVLESIDIPDCVNTIGFQAFACCTALNSVKLPVDWETASSSSNDGTRNTDTCGQIFQSCSNLKSIAVPEGMTSLPSFAFNGCSSIETITLPASLTEIKNHTFYNCTNLKEIEVPAQVASIGKSAFAYCSKLKTITLPTQLTSLGHYAFYSNRALETLHLPDSIESMGYQCLASCTSLTEVNIPANWNICPTSSTDDTISCDYCGQIFNGDSKLKEVTVPDTLQVLPQFAFNNCNYIETINLPSQMTQIQSHAFYKCSALKEITVPRDISVIEKSTFAYCSKLVNVQLPDTIVQIGDSAFYKCSALQSIQLPNTIKKMGYKAFAECTSLEEINIPESWEENPANANTTPSTSNSGQLFNGCKSLHQIELPEGFETIPDFAFNECDYLEEVVLPSSLTHIGKYSFYKCSTLQSVTLPDSIELVDQFAYGYCTGLRSVKLDGEESVIEENAFRNCSSLAAVSVTEGVSEIKTSSFTGCSTLNKVYYKGTQDEWEETGASKSKELTNSAMTYGILCEYTEPVKILEKSYTQPASESATDFYGGIISNSSHAIVDIDEVSFGPNKRNMYVSLPKDSYITYGFDKALMCPSNSVILITTTGNMNERADIYARTISGELIFVGTTYETKNQHTIELGEIDEYITGIKVVGRDLDGNSPGFDVVSIGMMAKDSGEDANIKTNTKVSMTRNGRSYNALYTTQSFKKESTEEVSVLVSADWQDHTPGTVALVQDGKAILTNKGGSFVDINPSKLFVENKGIYVALMDDQNKVVELIRTKIKIMSDKESQMQDLALDSVQYDYGAKHVDVLSSAHIVETTHSKFNLTCTAAVPDKVKSYELYSGSTLVDKNTTGKFENVDPSKLSAGAKVSIKTVGEKENVTTPLLLEIKSVNPLKETQLSLGGSGLSMKLDSDVPLLGGSDFNFNFPTGIPITCVVEDGKIKVGVNIAEKELYSSNSVSGVTTTNKTKYVVDNLKKDSIKEKFEAYKKDALKAQYLKDDFKGYITSGDYKADMPACKKKVNVKICGYLQGTWSDSLESISGELIVAISASQTFESQYMIVCVPVTVNVTVTGTGTVDANLGYDFINSKFYGDLGLGLSLSLEPYAGVGVGTWISAGVYGRATVGVDITLLATAGSSKTPGLEQAYISGDMGLKAYFAKETVGHLSIISTEDLNKTRLKEFMNGQNLVLYSTTRNSVLNRKTSVNANATVSDIMADTQALDERTNIEAQGASTFTGTLDQNHTLIQNVYNAANPQIVTCGDKTLIIYVDNDQSRALPNQTAVYYMLYNKDDDRFSEPKLLCDDDTADYQPQIVTDQNDIYVCYLNSTKSYEQNDDIALSDYAQTFGVAVAKFDTTTDSFQDLGTVYEDQYCYQPKLTVKDDDIVLTWAENSVGNIFGADGENTIKYAKYSENNWSDGIVLAEDKKAITSLAVGREDDEVMVAYAEDQDNDLSTLEQQVTKLDLAGDEKSSVKANVTNLKYSELPNANGSVLCGNQNGALVELTGNTLTKVFEEGFMDASSKFYVDGNAVYALKTNAQETRNIVCVKYIDANWYPVLLTDEKNYVDSLCVEGGKVTYLLTGASFSYDTEQKIDTTSDVKVLLTNEKNNVKVTGVTFDPYDIKPKKSCNFAVSITNNGNTKLDQVMLEFVPKNGSSAGVSKQCSVTIMPGETKVQDVSLVIPEDYASVEYVVKTEDNVLGTDDEDITVDMTKTDLRVDSEYLVDTDSRFVKAVVGNVSSIDTKATTKIKNPSGEVIYEKQDVIYANNFKEYLVEITQDELAEGEQTYTIETSADIPEFYDSNNNCEQLVWNICKEEPVVSENSVGNTDAGNTDDSKKDDNKDDNKDDSGVKPGDIWNSDDNTFTDPTNPSVNQENKVQISKVTVSGISHKIAAGKKIALTAKVSPSNATDASITWSSSNKKYAVVSQKGVVTTKKAGIGKTVTIAAKSNDGSNKSTKFKITIMKDAVKSVKISNAKKELKAGKSLKLKANVKTTGKNANKTLKWSSSNNKYATVNSKGVVKAKKAGKGKKVTITVKATDGTGKVSKVKIKIS